MRNPIWSLHRLKMNGVEPTARIRPWKVHRAKDSLLWVGDKSIVHATLIYERPGAVIKIGARTFIGKSTLIAAVGISVGDDVLISWGVTIVDHDSHAIRFEDRKNDVIEWGQGRKDWSNVPMDKVMIRDKVWIGFGATILKGVKIGEGAVVAAQSVVTKDVESHTVVAGNPAHFIRPC